MSNKPKMDTPEQPPAAPSETDALVDSWFAERIHNTAATREEGVVKLLLSAKDDLKKRLNDLNTNGGK